MTKPVCRIADCSNARLNTSHKRHSGQGNAGFEFLAVVNNNNLVCEAILCNLLLTYRSSESSANFYQTTQCYIPENVNIHSGGAY